MSAATPPPSKQQQQQQPLDCPMQEAGKYVKPVPWSSFFAVSAFVPIWAVTVLPLSVTYQLGKSAVTSIAGKNGAATSSSSSTTTTALDTGYVVQPSQIIPRANRKYDMVVLGATGFTGKLAARHLALTYGVGPDASIQWAIAGRSQEKLNAVKAQLAQELGMENIQTQLDTILVDTSIPSTLPKLVQQTRVVATTAGPYALYGSSVVEFCAKFGTHYVDITGEVDWVRAMMTQWQTTAQQTGATLIPFCGHDSIPWDLCVYKLQELLQQECKDNLCQVTFWDEMKGAAPGGTLATVFNAIEGTPLEAPRRSNAPFDPFLQLPDGSKSDYKVQEDLPGFIEKSQSPFHHRNNNNNNNNGWTMPFVMAAVNAKVVRWSHALRSAGSRSLVYREVAQVPDFKTAFVSYAGLGMFASMLFNPLTASLLKRFVLPKSGEGPSMENMQKNHFLSIKGEGIGENGNRAECIMYFNKDVGCLETSRMMVEAGLCLAKDEAKLPLLHQGGFVSPSAGLGNVLMDRLMASKDTVFRSRISMAQSKL